MPGSSEFNGPITGRNVIAGSHIATMNNFFGGDRSSRKREPFSTIPFAPDRDFVDRREILEWINDKCAGPGARAALVGLGGVGKSQLAIRYAHSIRDASTQTFVLWVHASTKARFEEAYRDIADKLELPERNDPKVDVLRLVSNWLCNETNGKWLMVVDNADDVEVFYPKQTRTINKSSPPGPTSLATFLPQSRNGSILITSRSKDAAARLAGGRTYIKEVPRMDESQSLSLFRNKLELASNEEGAPDLLRALDYIPLAITQAAAFINRRSRMTASDYLDDFRGNDKKRESLLNWDSGDLRRDESASNSVVLTWQMSFEFIREQRRSATDLLSIMSFFNPQGIPEWVLRRHSRSMVKIGDEGGVDSSFDEDLDTLRAYSLITATAGGGVYEMHALVHFCTRVWLSTFSNSRQWDREFLELMAREFSSADFKNWTKCQQLLPHVESLYKSELSDNESVSKWAQVLDQAAMYLQEALGKYGEAEKLNRRVLERREKELGEQHPDTLASVSNLALVLQHQGKYDEAEKLNRRVLERREKELGEQHPDTLASVSNLASVLQDQGKYDEAEKLNRRALEGYEKELGEQHPNTLTSVGNLALVLQHQGKYDEAEKLNRRALEGSEKELGEQHPDTLTSVSNLALVLQDQGKYDEAEKLNRRALEGYEKELGEQHPDTLTSVSNLASVLRHQGKYDEAEKLNRRALEGREKELGEQHPDTLASVSNLASVLQHQGKYDEAEKLNRRALEGREKELGEQHPDTLMSVSNLASVLGHQGKYDEAEKLNRRALEGREKELGEQHPDTLTSVSNLASMLQHQGKYDEAEKLNRRALEGREKELGEQHPNTLTSVYNLAYLLHKRKRYKEALGLYQRACDGYDQKLGTQHPTAVACLDHFSAMQQEAKQEGLGQSGALINDSNTVLKEISTCSFTSLNSSGTTPEPANSRRKSKQGSLYTRLKKRIYKKNV
ncbi:hypothetical protein BGZ60DRAFT_524713 [Tricladium varicosporioides]|nr:hypothetical protein BGZ60DRAFT_524713 [Hymenoscyphus varicosporioides]